VDNLIIFVLVIAAVWGLFLLPSLIEARREAPLTSTQRYDEVSARLSMTQARPGTARSGAAAARRRRTLIVSAVVALGTLAAAILTGNLWVLVAHLVVDAFIAWYVAMLVQMRRYEQQVALAQHIREAPVEHHAPEVRVIAG
jgi:Flp pilus assembly protein TadB